MMKRPLLSCCVLWLSFAGSLPARADLLPPETLPCVGQRAGDPCPGGTCRDSTCAALDYAAWDRDASNSPPSKTSPCLKCLNMSGQPGALDAGPSSEDASAADSGGKDGGKDGHKDDGDGGCTLASPSRSRSLLASLALAGSVSLLLRRRRRLS